MIIGFKHKGLKAFHETGSTHGIKTRHAKKLKEILTILERAMSVYEINKSYRPHHLKGSFKEYYAVSVDKNWRVIFQFRDNGFDLIDYLDYH